MGWVVGWKKSANSETTPHSFPRTSFWMGSRIRLATGNVTLVERENPIAFRIKCRRKTTHALPSGRMQRVGTEPYRFSKCVASCRRCPC